MKSEDIPFERSFASHIKSNFWSNKNKLKPHQVYKSSYKKYLFDCNVCNHIFEKSTNHITNKNSWCTYCTNKKLCENDGCTTCFENSFASHPKSKFWSNKNKLNPRQVFKHSNHKYLFDCDKCNHILDITLNSISTNNNWCSYCAHQKLCKNEDCQGCFENSFASHHKSKFWADKNSVVPRTIFKSSANKYWFDCNICTNEFYTKLSNITNGIWCPFCVNKTELKLFDWLKKQNFNVKTQVKFDWCKNKKNLPFDFVLEDYKLIIELDGPQHFRQVSNWQSPEYNKENDEFKNKSALDNRYRMIRICQTIVLHDFEDWGNQLINAINSDKILIKIGSVYNK